MTGVEVTPCPACGELALRIEWRWKLSPVGSFSLAGMTPKAPARRWPWCVCDACGIEAEGKWEAEGPT